ncbi:MAG: hypothetical protein ACTSRP_20730 [Candidatus Helarchaeota archaeon]
MSSKVNRLLLGFIRNFVPIKEKTVHTEAFVRDELWKILKKKLGCGYVWFVITPANFDFCVANFNLKMTKNNFSKILKERILYLKEKGEQIELHLHLSCVREFLDNDIQEKKFYEAIDFLNGLEIRPKKFSPGWFIYNNYTIELLKKNNIKYLYTAHLNPFKKPDIINGIKIIYIHKYWHDYDFI